MRLLDVTSTALVGGVGGHLFATAMFGGSRGFVLPPDACITAVTVCTALLSAFVGRHLRALWANKIAFVFAIAAAGAANGLLSMILVIAFVEPKIRGEWAGATSFAAMLGFFVAIPFMPALAALASSAKVVGKARARSVVDGCHRRAVWTRAGLVVAIATGLVSLTRMAEMTAVMAFIAWGAATLCAAMLIADAAALRHLVTVRARIERGEAGDRLDVGLGDQRLDVQSEATYRAGPTITGQLRGDVARGMQELAAAIGHGAYASGIAMAIGMLVVWFHMTP